MAALPKATAAGGACAPRVAAANRGRLAGGGGGGEYDDNDDDDDVVDEHVQFCAAVATFLGAWATCTPTRPRTPTDALVPPRCVQAVDRFVRGLCTDLRTFLGEQALRLGHDGTFLASCPVAGTGLNAASPPAGADATDVHEVRGTFTKDASAVLQQFPRGRDLATLRKMWVVVSDRVVQAAAQKHKDAWLDMVGTLPLMEPFLRALFGVDCGLVRVCTWLHIDAARHLSVMLLGATLVALHFPRHLRATTRGGVVDLSPRDVAREVQARKLNINLPLPVVVAITLANVFAMMPRFTLTLRGGTARSADDVENGLTDRMVHLLRTTHASLNAKAKHALAASHGVQAVHPLVVHAFHTHTCMTEHFCHTDEGGVPPPSDEAP